MINNNDAIEKAEKKLRDFWNKEGVPLEIQEKILRMCEEKAQPGAMVGPFKIGGGPA